MVRLIRALCGAALAIALTTPARAHHALGGALPADFGQGFLSGLAHPVINFDHFAFVVAVGVLTAVGQASKFLPVWFVGGTIVGCVLAANGITLPFAGWLAHLALLIIGAALAFGYRHLRLLDIAAFAVAGLFHGGVYAEAIIGTAHASLNGYLIGFAIIQTVVATGAMMAVYMLWAGDRLYANARVVGGFVAGVGLTVLAQSGVAALFPPL